MSKIDNRILNLISNYTAKEISEKEYFELLQWINETKENEVIFKEYVLLYKKSRHIVFADQLNTDTAWNSILSKLNKPFVEIPEKKAQKVILFKKHWFSYAAAIVIGIVSTTYLLKDNLFPTQQNNAPILEASKNTIEVGTDKAILTLEDGSNITLINGNSIQTKNATSNGKEIVYASNTTTKSAIAYNYLTVPRGGQFFIKLSDGTQVWLNSESQLKYPVSFIDGELRTVELVYGEAYFDVSPSTQHKGSKFSVFNKSQEITVLGTAFNVKAYKDESAIYTTLVEGVVAVSFDKNNQKLLPNQQLKLNIANNSSTVKTIDVEDEISWKKGIFSFRKKSLEDIMKVLSRWYDLDVKFENTSLKNAGFNGIIGKDQKIEEILEIIKNYGILKEYEIKEKTVILK